MENLSIIAAIGSNRELGNKNELLWHIKEDLIFYKKMTMGKNIIMGRKTLESMPKNALIGRKSIVLSRSLVSGDDTIKYFSHFDDLIHVIKNSNEEFMVVGGASIYSQILPYVDTMYLTSINDSIMKVADCYFPEFDICNWAVELLKEGNTDTLSYKIKRYVRKK